MLLLPFTAIVAAVASAASTPEIPQKKPIKMDFSVLRGNSRSSATKGAIPELVKRDGLAELTLNNEQTYYAATLKIGSQGAENSVVVDTGSSDLWIMSSGVECSSSSSYYKRAQEFNEFLDVPERSHRRLMDFEIPNLATGSEPNEKRADTTVTIEQTATGLATAVALQIGGGSSAAGSGSGSGGTCTAAGSFNTAALDSFKVNSTAPDFSISYADGTYANGFWGHDYVDFGSSNVSDCSFAVVNDTTLDTGVFGIGFAQLETTYSGSTLTRLYTYENFPLRLKETGQINKVLYSLYLNTADALSGSVLFGAVDHAKYSGQLQTVPIINIYSSYYRNPIRFDIVLDLITLESSSQNVSVLDLHIPALLDSGTTLTYLPTAILSSLVSLLGGSLSLLGYYRVSCSYNTNRAFAVFNFSGVEIKVPMSDLILSLGSTCYLGVLGQSSDSLTGSPYAILGDNFLRNAYIVYDLEDYEISLAQVNYSSSEDIEVVLSSVPLAVQAPDYSSTAVASSVTSGSTSSELSSLGLKKSQGTNAIHFAKSMFFALAGVCMLFVL